MRRGKVNPREPTSEVQYFATCHPGLEEVVARELADPRIGARNIAPGSSGVAFTGVDLTVGYRANLWLRSAIRVLTVLAEGDLNPRRPAGDTIYDFVRSAVDDWCYILPEGRTFMAEARVWSCSNVSSSHLVVQRVRDAVCDELRDRRGSKPEPPEEAPDVPLFVTLYQDHIKLYRDMSGDSLHRRGWRKAMHRASLNEAAAAGMLHLAGWPEACQQPDVVLADPMCGSGTLLIEAALMAQRRAPGLLRAWWPFFTWPDFDKRAWLQAVQAAEGARVPWKGTILGNDIHPGALALAKQDASEAGVADLIRFHCGPAAEFQPPARPGIVITNPPWGLRLTVPDRSFQRDREQSGGDRYGGSSRRDDRYGGFRGGPPPVDPEEQRYLEDAWGGLSHFLKQHCPEAQATVLSGNADATRYLRMKATRKFPISIGGADARVLTYHVLPPKKPDAVQANIDSDAMLTM